VLAWNRREPINMKHHTREYHGVYAKTLAKYGQTVLVFSHPELETDVQGSWSEAQLVISGVARDVHEAVKLLDVLEPEALEQMHHWQHEAPERHDQSNYERLKNSRLFIKGFGLAIGPRLTGDKPVAPKKLPRAERAGWSAGRQARVVAA
jgi:hypothetical protein